MAVKYFTVSNYPSLSIARQLQDLIKKFSMLDRWSKKKRNKIFWQKKEILLLIWAIFFVIFCHDLSRRELEKQNNLHMSDRDHSFYEDQKDQRKQKCLDIVESQNFF